MRCTILDCYTDEPAGLGVPPFLGTYPRYWAGRLMLEGHNVQYLTIDDLRTPKALRLKSDIRTLNRTRPDSSMVLADTSLLIVICGIHVPGKYLSALPATLYEVAGLIRGLRCHKLLSGPAATSFGTRLEGGRRPERMPEVFDSIEPFEPDYPKIAACSAKGASIVRQIPFPVIAELETAHGCSRQSPCSFCTEPLKHRLEYRPVNDILSEAAELAAQGVRHFRLGKQSDFFSRSEREIEAMLKGMRKLPGLRTLHIDNVDPATVTEAKVRLVVKYCTEGNVAALGIESFDPEVIRQNSLNSTQEKSLRAVRLIHSLGSERGPNGMPRFLAGINLLFGLKGETKATHAANIAALRSILDEGLLIRRINIRQVALFPGTPLFEECGDRFLKKNRRHYWKWRNEIRQKIDNPMLKRIVPVGTVLKGVRMEVHDGNTTFGRQWGTYPLIVGVKERLELGRSYDVKIVGHMLRSVTGTVLLSEPLPSPHE